MLTEERKARKKEQRARRRRENPKEARRQDKIKYRQGKERRAVYLIENREKLAAQARARYLRNKEQILKRQAEYVNENKQYVKAWHQKHYRENMDRHKENGRNWRLRRPTYAKEYREEKKERIKNTVLRRKYGVSLSVYTELRKRPCPICGRNPNDGPRDKGMDHDHVTGVTREILCTQCNIGLGMFNDDPRELYRAALYIMKHNKKQGLCVVCKGQLPAKRGRGRRSVFCSEKCKCWNLDTDVLDDVH